MAANNVSVDDTVRELFGTSSDEEEEFRGFTGSDLEVDLAGSGESGSDSSDSEPGEDDGEDTNEEAMRDGESFTEWFERCTWQNKATPFSLPEYEEASGVLLSPPDVENAEAIDFFQLFFTDDLFMTIVSESEKYARQKGDNSFRTSLEEMKAFFGVHIIMGFHKLPSISDYWSGSDLLGVDKVKKTFSRDRFRKILQFLHLRDSLLEPARGSPDFDKIYKVRDLVDFLSDRFMSVYAPARELSIDEGMIGFKGRISIKQYMPAKPTKHGIKVWIIAEARTGYVSDFDVYLGKMGEGIRHEFGLGYSVVMNLARPFFHQNRILFFDNYFNSVQLQADLLRVNTFACGTQIDSRKLFPSALKGMKKRGQLKTGELKMRQKGPMVVMCWRDKRLVCLLSTSSEKPDPQRSLPLPPAPAKLEHHRAHGASDTSMLTNENETAHFIDSFLFKYE